MRYVYLLILIVLVVVIGAFAVVNRAPVQVNFPFSRAEVVAPLFLTMLAVYVLGMFTGWTVVGFVRQSIKKASEHHRHHSHE